MRPAQSFSSSPSLPVVSLELSRIPSSFSGLLRMILRSIPSLLDRPPSFLPPKSSSAPLRRTARSRERILLLHCRRRRWRIRSVLDELFHDLVLALPSPSSLDLLLTPAVGLAAGAALCLSSLRRRSPDVDEVVGNWVLFTSPTPFNRSVLLRCPSISFEDGGVLLDGVNERLLAEERHCVNLSRGRIPAVRREGEKGPEEEVQYQRICVRTDDGGVISLDWPENLDLRKEHGLDTTVLIVPGTAEGSMDRYVKTFVFDALQHGFFPIVMNPRGCAGSPLTTPRLFTAADSDDVFAAVQFISVVRPWTTVMGVGLGYGANMLTKYLAEVGESTVLTAAVCIDNPFDLAEATGSLPYHIALDQKLRSGLTDILRANKELFQGKAKGFDVGKALSAKSVREFDGAISMVSHGCQRIEDFYSMTSTRKSIGSLKVPVLFVQIDDETVPAFSIPRGSISENPFTSLLICSYLPSPITRANNSALCWCQHLAIEWMSAVELSLLKGRHPLLKDVDLPINPSKGLAFVDKKGLQKNISGGVRGSYDSPQLYISGKIADEHTYRKLTQLNPVNGFLYDQTKNDAAVQGDVNVNFYSSELQQIESDFDDQTKHSINVVDSKKDNSTTAMNEGDEESKVSSTAVVVMNMLDVTMPGTLNEEQKNKVLSAVGRGENLMRALEEAVPEDVRGKLTSAVTEILQTQGTKVKFEGLDKLGWIPNVTSKVKSQIQDKVKEISVNEKGNEESNSGVDHKGKVQDDPVQLNSASDGMQEIIDLSEQKISQSPEILEDGSRPSQGNNLERAGYMREESCGDQHKATQSQGMADRYTEDDKVQSDSLHIPNSEGKKSAANEEQNMSNLTSNSEESISSGTPASASQVMQQESNELQKNEDKGTPDIHQNSHVATRSNEAAQISLSKPPSISVTQALDALTGFDDSTQLAVNSVFGVLENMIDQLEKSSSEGDDDEMKTSEDEESRNSSPGMPTINRDNYGKTEHANNILSEGSNISRPSKYSEDNSNDETHSKEVVDNKLGKNMASNKSSAEHYSGICEVNALGLSSFKTNCIDKFGPLQSYPLHVIRNPYYWGSPYEAYLTSFLSNRFPRPRSSDLDSATDLILDPEKGQWKMLEQASSSSSNQSEGGQNQNINGFNQIQHHEAEQSDTDDSIETSYVISNSEFPKPKWRSTENVGMGGDQDVNEEVTLCMVRNNLLDSLKVEVGRRLTTSNLKEIEGVLVDDMKQIVDTIARAVVPNNQLNLKSFSEVSDLRLIKVGGLEGEGTVKIITSAVEKTSHLKKVLPVGVIVGSLLASLRNYFKISASHDQSKVDEKVENIQERLPTKEVNPSDQSYDDQKDDAHDGFVSGDKISAKVNSKGDRVMIGSVTAALGATALLAHHQQNNAYSNSQIMEVPPSASSEKGSDAHGKSMEAIHEKNPISIVSNLAEKAMSVAGPVVPTKDGGEVDQERLVATLAELGQKGGLLKLVGKLALLWGGIRGAMSLTDRLISFLHIAERPLLQRVICFSCMVLVLWSPVVVPLLPTLLQSWSMKTSNIIVEYACVLGLYVSSMILVVLWGKRIRGYDNPLEQYGLDCSAPRVLGFMKGLVGGTVIVMSVHSLNGLLGYASLSWPSSPPSFSASPILFLKSFANVLLQGLRSIVTATGVALAEELLFRSWLLEEVEVDLGYYPAIVITGIAFSLVHGSLHSVPGFLLLSLALFGIKQRSQDKIYVPIGVRAGIMCTNYTLQTGGFIKYELGTPSWLMSMHPLHPFDGVVGVGVCALLAILFFPKQRHKRIYGKGLEEQNG